MALAIGSPTAGERRASTLLLVTVVAIVGLNIRAALGALPPLLPAIRDDYTITNTQAGLLTSIAAVGIGLFAPLGQRLGARVGAETATGWCLAALSVTGLAHLIDSSPLMLFATMTATGAAMGAASALIPALIARHAHRSRGFVMGVYTTGMALGIAASAALATPLERTLGGWRPAMACSGVFAGIAAVIWTLSIPRRPAAMAEVDLATDRRLPWRSRTARLVTAYMACQMIFGYGCMAWIAPLYLSLGRSPEQSAAMLVLFQTVQLATMLGLPTLTDHLTDRRPLLFFATGSAAVGITLLLVDPIGLAVPAVTLTGLGIGGGATLGLILIIDTTTSVADGSRLTAMSLLVGNLFGAAGPLLLGAIKDSTGSFRPGFAVMLALTLLLLPLLTVFRPGRRL